MAETNQWVGSYISDMFSSKITSLGRGKKSSKAEKCSLQFNFLGTFLRMSGGCVFLDGSCLGIIPG